MWWTWPCWLVGVIGVGSEWDRLPWTWPCWLVDLHDYTFKLGCGRGCAWQCTFDISDTINTFINTCTCTLPLLMARTSSIYLGCARMHARVCRLRAPHAGAAA